MATEELKFRIGADTSELEAGMEAARGKINGLTAALTALGGLALFDKLLSGFKEIVHESSDADLTMRRFYTGMKAGGQALDVSKFNDFAEGMAKITVNSKDAVVAAAAVLTRFGANQAQIQSLIPAAADLSAALGIDLTDATERMGTALATGGRGLTGLGLGFNKHAKEVFEAASQSERMNIILQRVNQTVAGSAGLLNNSAIGALTRFNVSMSELKESLGRVVEVPFAAVVRTIGGAIDAATAAIDNLNPATSAFFGRLATGALVISGAGVAIGAIVTALGAMGLALKTLTAALPLLRAGFVTTFTGALTSMAPIVVALAGIVLAVGIVRIAVDTFSESFSAAFDALRAKMETMKGYLKGFTANFIELTGLGNIWNKLSGTFGSKQVQDATGITGISKVLGDSVGGIKAAWGAGIHEFGSFFDYVMGGMDKVADDTTKKFKDLAKTGSGNDAPLDAAREALKKEREQKRLEARMSVLRPDPVGPETPAFTRKTMQELASAPVLDNRAIEAAKGWMTFMGQGAEAQENASQFLARVREQNHISSEAMAVIATEFKGNANDVVEYAEQWKGLSAQAMTAMLDTAGMTHEAMSTIAADFRDTAKVTRQALDNAKAALEKDPTGSSGGSAAADLVSGALAGLNVTSQQVPQGAGSRFATAAAGKFGGDMGTTIQAGIQGGAMGGPVGAAAAIGLDLLTKTKNFSMVTESLATLLSSLTDGLEPLLQAVAIVLMALKPAFDVLRVAIGAVSEVVLAVVKAIAWVYNGILDALQTLLGWTGQDFQAYRLDVDNPSRRQSDTVGELARPAQAAADGLRDVATSSAQASAGITNAAQGMKVSQRRYEAVMAEDMERIAQVVAAQQRSSALLERLRQLQANPSILRPFSPRPGSQMIQSVLPDAPPKSIGTSGIGMPGGTTVPVRELKAGVTINVATSDPVVLARKVRDQMERDNFLSGRASMAMTGFFSQARTV